MPGPRGRRAPAGRRRATVRPAGPRDLDTLVAHRMAMWRDIGNRTESAVRTHGPVYRDWVRPRLRTGEFEAVIAVLDGRVAGSGAPWWMPTEPRPGSRTLQGPQILSMYTEPEFRRRGIATAVVRELLRRARRRDADRVTLHASEEGEPVYARLGFEKTREMRKWIRRRGYRRAGHAPVRSRGRVGARR